jgi:hypothetical protein
MKAIMNRTTFFSLALAWCSIVRGSAAGLIPVSIAYSTNPPSASGNDFSSLPVMTPDGRFVVFQSEATDLTEDHDTVRYDVD